MGENAEVLNKEIGDFGCPRMGKERKKTGPKTVFYVCVDRLSVGKGSVQSGALQTVYMNSKCAIVPQHHYCVCWGGAGNDPDVSSNVGISRPPFFSTYQSEHFLRRFMVTKTKKKKELNKKLDVISMCTHIVYCGYFL